MKILTFLSVYTQSVKPAILPIGRRELSSKAQDIVPGFAKLPPAVIQEDFIILPERFPPIPTRRLVVLIPTEEIDEKALARHVWQLASSSGLSVLFLTISPELEQNSYQRRRLANLAAETSSYDIQAHASVSTEKKWIQALKQKMQSGDLPVCLAGHKASGIFVWRKTQGAQLAELFGVPVYMIGGIKITAGQKLRAWSQEILAWIASLALIAAFLIMQVEINRWLAEPASTILLALTILAEVYILYKVFDWIG